MNPWKHEGALKGEKTKLINDPRGVLSGYRVSLSGLRDVRPLEINELEMDFDAHDIARKLVAGIDSAYAIFLDDSSPLQQKRWFSPAQCSSGRRCKRCKKELVPCERCEEELEMVGEKIRCMCDENSESIREAIRWLRYCETLIAPNLGIPKRTLKMVIFCCRRSAIFSSVSREINQGAD